MLYHTSLLFFLAVLFASDLFSSILLVYLGRYFSSIFCMRRHELHLHADFTARIAGVVMRERTARASDESICLFQIHFSKNFQVSTILTCLFTRAGIVVISCICKLILQHGNPLFAIIKVSATRHESISTMPLVK